MVRRPFLSICFLRERVNVHVMSGGGGVVVVVVLAHTQMKDLLTHSDWRR